MFANYNETMEIIIDKIAIWRGDLHPGYSVKEVPIGMRVADKTGILRVTEKPMWRYAKNYKVGKTKFVLFVRTYNNDMTEVFGQLDKVAKGITERYAKEINALPSFEDFRYLNEYIGV